MKTLADAVAGETVKIVRISGFSAIKQRLLDMGITRGMEVKVERYAPLRDPIQITVKGYSLALRVSEGKMIEVEAIEKQLLHFK
ncbi:MAG: FeoA family protein [Victivallaceae bacterium]